MTRGPVIDILNPCLCAAAHDVLLLTNASVFWNTVGRNYAFFLKWFENMTLVLMSMHVMCDSVLKHRDENMWGVYFLG